MKKERGKAYKKKMKIKREFRTLQEELSVDNTNIRDFNEEVQKGVQYQEQMEKSHEQLHLKGFHIFPHCI